MKAVEFCYWLQGLFEVAEPTELNAKQTDLIKRHLNMVFIHDIDQRYPADQQELLNEAHAPPVELHPNDFINSVMQEVMSELSAPVKPNSNLPLYLQKNATEEQLDAKYGKGNRPRC